MLFNSIDFAVFLPVVFALYWLLDRYGIRWQNTLIVAASYLFYGWWDYRFLSLILASTLVDFLVGNTLGRTMVPQKRRWLLWTSILVNLGLLGFFKYYNFFLDNLVATFTLFGAPIEGQSLEIVLPVGISFYTFQTLSYTIDIYRGKLEPTRDFIAFASFVSFFPQLVAGPIERATNLLPQFETRRVFNYQKAVDGMRQILWGLFKKIVIADGCAVFVNQVYGTSGEQSGGALLLATFFFAIQIYSDFSGYSDIAIGTARLFGFSLMKNFAFPYFSRDIAEFWRRWHISLSTWFRDYVYIPLGGSRGNTWFNVRNVFIIFLVSGFWHGANWTFIIWGALNAAYFLPLLLMQRNRRYLDTVAHSKLFPRATEMLSILGTFALTLLGWVFFRSQTVGQAWEILGSIFSPSVIDTSGLLLMGEVQTQLGLVAAFIATEWIGRSHAFALEKLGLAWPKWLRLSFYLALAVLTAINAGEGSDFIYFQF